MLTFDPNNTNNQEAAGPVVESIDHEMDGKLDRFLDDTGKITTGKIEDEGVDKPEVIKAPESLPLLEKLKEGIEKYQELEGNIDQIADSDGLDIDDGYVGGMTMARQRQIASVAVSMKEKGNLPVMREELSDIKNSLGQKMEQLIKDLAHDPEEANEVFEYIDNNVQSDSLNHYLLNFKPRLHFAHNLLEKRNLPEPQKPESVGEIIPPVPAENVENAASDRVGASVSAGPSVSAGASLDGSPDGGVPASAESGVREPEPEIVEKPQEEKPERPKGYVAMAEIGPNGDIQSSLAGQDHTKHGEARIEEIKRRINNDTGTTAPKNVTPENIEKEVPTPAEVIEESAATMPVKNKSPELKPEEVKGSVAENQKDDISGQAGVVEINVNKTPTPEQNIQSNTQEPPKSPEVQLQEKKPGFFARIFGGDKKDKEIEAHSAAAMHEEVAGLRPKPEETKQDTG